jgi:hypothetical protein
MAHCYLPKNTSKSRKRLYEFALLHNIRKRKNGNTRILATTQKEETRQTKDASRGIYVGRTRRNECRTIIVEHIDIYA